MVIVAGHVTVDPSDRERYLATCHGVVAQARSAAGCLDFAISADLVDPGRVNIYERWEAQADVDAFRSGGTSTEGDPSESGPSEEQAAMIRAGRVAEYDVNGERALL